VIITRTILWGQRSEVHPGTIRLVCAELVALGLLHDEGVGRLSTPAMEYFVATDISRWFMKWIIEREPGPK
jgi:hypothetical protein